MDDEENSKNFIAEKFFLIQEKIKWMMHQDKKEEALKLCLDPKVKQLVDSAN